MDLGYTRVSDLGARLIGKAFSRVLGGRQLSSAEGSRCKNVIVIIVGFRYLFYVPGKASVAGLGRLFESFLGCVWCLGQGLKKYMQNLSK